MTDTSTIIHDEEGINYDDIPEVKDFSTWRKNPYAGRFKAGYTVIVEHEGYDEIRNYDFTKIPYPKSGNPIPVDVAILKSQGKNR